jgi:N-acetylmuramoyl-L-alanine amidase
MVFAPTRTPDRLNPDATPSTLPTLLQTVLPILILLAILLPGSRGLAANARVSLPLADGARQHDLRVARTPGSREVTLSGDTHRFSLQIDSSRIEHNDVAVWLSNPVTLVDNQVHVAIQDLHGVFRTLLSPPRMPTGRRVRTICIDAGHGGKDPGHKAGSRLEKTYSLAMARELRTRLVEAGFTVVMTRRDDEFVDHPDRTSIATRNKADLFISLHFNASPDGSPDARGIEVYAMTPEGARSTNFSRDVGSLKAWAGNESDAENLLLAVNVQRSLLARLPGSLDRGVRRARFLVLRLSEMPAILVEGGFMSNPSDARWIYSETGRRRLAQAIVDGIQAYRRQVERAPAQRSTNSTSSTTKARPDSARN